MKEDFKISDFFHAFNRLYFDVLADKSNTEISMEFSRLTHGSICKYTKDLQDALLCFRNRFNEGKPYILKDITALKQLLASPQIENAYTPDQIESLTTVINKLSDSYESLCKFINEQNF